jgi:hypothetical protein
MTVPWQSLQNVILCLACVHQQSLQSVTASLISQPRSSSMTESVSSVQQLTSSVVFFKLKSCSVLY